MFAKWFIRSTSCHEVAHTIIFRQKAANVSFMGGGRKLLPGPKSILISILIFEESDDIIKQFRDCGS